VPLALHDYEGSYIFLFFPHLSGSLNVPDLLFRLLNFSDIRFQ